MSPGSDPFGAFQRFAAEMGYKDKILAISLGQGQGPVAAKLIEQGIANGEWVFLQVKLSSILPIKIIKLMIKTELSLGHIMDVSNGENSAENCRRFLKN